MQLKITLISIALFLIGVQSVTAQESGGDDRKFHSMLYVTEGYGGEQSEFSLPGISYELSYSASERLSVLFGAHLLLWRGQDMNTFSLNIGPQLGIMNKDRLFVDAYLQGGTILVVGNDYAGFFGNILGGFKIGKKLSGSKALIVGFGIDHAMAFNSGYTYGFLSLGYRF